MPKPTPVPDVLSLVLTVRGKRVLLDSDLARLYGVPTKQLNQQIRRNAAKFPDDFAFQLNYTEAVAIMRSRSQNATLKRGQNIKYRPYVFTDYGAIQVANVLNSPTATAMSIYVVRSFMQMREELLTSAAILKKLAEIDRTLIEHDGALRSIWHQLQPLLQPPSEPPKRRIGFIS
jgi:phage regulator Rha-like protein